MRIYNILTRSTLFYTTKTTQICEEDSEGFPVKYNRNFNVSTGENLPCLVKIAKCPKQMVTEMKAMASLDSIDERQISNDRYLGITKEMGKDPCDFSYSTMFYIPPPQSSKTEDAETI